MAKFTVFVTDYTLAQEMDLEAEILAETDAELVIAQCRTEAEVLEALVDCDAIITQWAPVTRPIPPTRAGDPPIRSPIRVPLIARPPRPRGSRP